MDKSEFIKLAPQYYALAIGLSFEYKGSPLTRQSIMNEYLFHDDEGDDPYSLVDDFSIWNLAIDWLRQRDMIVVYTDPFGPPIYNKSSTFDSQWNDLCRNDRPFENARQSGDEVRWTREA